MTSPTDHVLVCDRLFDGARLHERPMAVHVAGGRIVALAPAEEYGFGIPRRRLAPGALLAPGFIDLQVNGGGGVLFNDDPTPAGLAAIAAAHRRHGTTGFLPTLITDARETIARAIAAVRTAIRAGLPGILGIHLEGPFLNPARKGVHRPELMAPPTMADVELLSALGADGVTLVTLAPERVPKGFVAALRARGVIVAAGHSDAGEADMRAALAEGLTGVTHLYNAMSQLAPREAGVTGTALAEPALLAGIIADGLHVSPTSLRIAFRAKGARRLALVTDAMPSVGAAGSGFDLFGVPVRLRDGRLTTPDGTLAGAHLDMAAAVRNARALMGASEAEALTMATRTPAAFLGLGRRRGRIAPGAAADFVLLNAAGEAIETWIAGAPSNAESL